MGGKMGYAQVYVTCPFFRGYTRNSVSCEGCFDGGHLTTTFDTPAGRARHMEVFCNRHNECCEVYRAVYEAKYADDEK